MACVRNYNFLIDAKMLDALKIWLIDIFTSLKSNGKNALGRLQTIA